MRASGEKVDRPERKKTFGKKAPKKGQTNPQYVSKKARKAMKEKADVEKEYAEAEMQVSTEEKQRDVSILPV